MSSDPLPDHYKALGVDKTADAATVKSTYRKLVLKCHPDKVTDPELKQQKQEEFHKIQEAYEVLVDDQKRADYEARLTLEALRKEKAARTATADKSTRFAGGASYMSAGSSRYATEERKPRAYDEDDRYYEERSRKYDTYPAYPKNSTSPRSKESTSKGGRPTASDRTRSERTKTRDRETRSDRKFVSVESESSSDEKEKFATEYRRRSAEVEARKASDSRRKAEDRRSYEDTRYGSATRKMSAQEDEALRYQHKSRTQVEAETRPSIPRTSSRDYFVESRSSRKESRPEAVRRSSARPKERQPSSARIIPEIVDWSEHRIPPPFKHSSSSPANIEIPRSVPNRTQTDSGREYRHVEASSPPSFSRSTTMPSVTHSSSRRKDSGAPRPSGLREAMTPEQGSTEQDGFPFIPQPQSSTKYYHYPTPGGSVPLRQEDILGAASNHRTILREPERHRHRSPSPLTRPPIGPNRPSEPSSPPQPSRSNTRHLSPSRAGEERGRAKGPLYGEIGGSRGRQASYTSGNVQFSRKYGPEDVKWAPRSQENEREYASKPTMGRTATFVY